MNFTTPLRDELAAEYALGMSVREPLRRGDAIIVYGAGRGGRQFLAGVRDYELNICFVCDDNPDLQRGAIDGVPLAAPEAIRAHLDTPVVVALAHYQDVVARLRQWGVRRRLFSDDFGSHFEGAGYDYVRGYFDAELIGKSWDQIEAFDRLLADAHSRQTLRNLLRYRLSRSLEHAETCPYAQYQHPLVRARAGDVVIDGGAWTGDVAAPFAAAVGATGRVYAFEPAPATFALLQETVARADFGSIVTPVPMGLGSREEQVRFAFAGRRFGSSGVDATGEITVLLTTLDAFCASRQIRPTLIKMDIEGAERDALEGARGTIANQAPRLQICLYHTPADLWEIPARIHEICPSYRFYLGHHERELAETVLYATRD